MHAVTAGNPFFVTEVLASEGQELPVSVRDAVVGRAAGLSTGARAALETAAVVPDRVELDLLFAVSGASPDDLEECERADLLEIGSRASRRTGTSWPATRCSTASPPYDVEQLHAAVVRPPAHAAPGTTRRASPTTPTWPATSATVLTYAVTAAEQAALLGSHREAAAQMDRALAHLDAADPDRAAAILGRAADALPVRPAGSMTALAASTRAVALRREQDDVDLAVQLATLSRMLWVQARGTESRAAIDEAVELVTARPGSPGEVHGARAPTARWRCWLARSRARWRPVAARSPWRASGETRPVWCARSTPSAPPAGSPYPTRPNHFSSSRCDAAERLRDDIGVAAAMVNLGSGAGEVRRYETARRWLEEARSFCAERDLDHSEHYAISWVARIDLEQGRLGLGARAGRAAPPGHAIPISRIGALTVAGQGTGAAGRAGCSRRCSTRPGKQPCGSGHLQRLWPVAAGRAEARLGGRSTRSSAGGRRRRPSSSPSGWTSRGRSASSAGGLSAPAEMLRPRWRRRRTPP